MIEVVAAIIQKDGRVLATQRGYGDMAGAWEFPGGKIEPGEQPQTALLREIREELRADIKIEKLLGTVTYSTPNFHLIMHCYLCHLKQENFELIEHTAARWISSEEFDTVDWLPADTLILPALQQHLSLCSHSGNSRT